LVQEAVRVLKPGGLLITGTANPALEFVYEHFGFAVVKRLELNFTPKNQGSRFDETSAVPRLRDYLYGPQDYGLIGRR